MRGRSKALRPPHFPVFLLIFALLDFPTDTTAPSGFSANVIDIHRPEVVVLETADGERFTVTVIGMDSPGPRHPRMPKGVYLEESMEQARMLLLGRAVTIEVDSTLSTAAPASADTLPRHIRLSDGRSYAEAMIRDGYARYLAEVPFETERMARYETAQTQARLLKRGVWGREEVRSQEFQSYGYKWDDFGQDFIGLLYLAGIVTLCVVSGGSACITTP